MSGLPFFPVFKGRRHLVILHALPAGGVKFGDRNRQCVRTLGTRDESLLFRLP